ncbi:MAG: prephenate dehydrogenase [bacterium]
MKSVAVIGVGLIGGSLVKDIKRLHPTCEIIGLDHSDEHLSKALELSLIDRKGTITDLSGVDMAIIAIPVDQILKSIDDILNHVGENTVVIDVGSTKSAICLQVKDHPKRRNFLAAHPIAGTEFSGPEAAHEGLFEGKTNIICEVEKTAFKLQEKVLQLFSDLGMRIRYMDPKAHDKHIAYVSHLSHISAFMLGKTVIEEEQNERDIFDLAGSGFESTVRLAKSSPEMWTPIFKQNKTNVIQTLESYISHLQNFKDLMKADDFDGVYKEMKNTNYIKEILKGIK